MTGALEARALAGIDEAATLELLRRLVEAPTGNPPGHEEPVAHLLAAFLADAGVEPDLDEIAPGRPNLTAQLGRDGGPVLLLNGHTDTMPAGEGWSTPPHEPAVRDGLLYGLGACDMKGGLAAMAAAICAVSRAGIELCGHAILDAVIDEEDGGSGTKRTLVLGRRADFAIVGEPTGLQVVRAGNGQVNADVRFLGRAAHGSTPEQGHNAVYDAAELIRLVEVENERLAAHRHPLIGPASTGVGTVAGGLRTSIVPAACTVGIDRRLVPGQTPEGALADLDRLIATVVEARPGARAQRTVTCSYSAFETPEDASVCRVLRAAASEAGGREVGFAGMRATTDASFLAEAGIPTVIFGPGSLDHAHRPDERVPVEEVLQAARALALAIVRLLAR